MPPRGPCAWSGLSLWYGAASNYVEFLKPFHIRSTLILSHILIIAIVLSQILGPAALQSTPVISSLDCAISTAHQSQSSSPVVTIGAFTNMRYDPEHAYGYTAELWRERNRIFGFFLSSQGLIGDTPTGLLEDVTFNPRTGKLTFRARLTTGLVSNRDFHMVPSRDVFRFSGVLKGNRMIGTLEIANALTPSEPSRREKISLKRSQRKSEVLIEAKSYDDWKSEAEKILKFRGPKW